MAPRGVKSAPGPKELNQHLRAETDLLNLQCEHVGNRESIRRMLKPGAVDRAKSCENHFYDCGHKQERRDWSSGSTLTFRKMLHEIYIAPTPGAFEANRRKLIDWTDKKNRKTRPY